MIEFIEILTSQITSELTLRVMLAAGIGAAAGFPGARLLTLTCLAGGDVAAWLLITDIGFAALPQPVLYGFVGFAAAGILEAAVVLLFGRDTAPQFWGSVLAGALMFVVLAPVHVLRRAGGVVSAARWLAGILRVTRH